MPLGLNRTGDYRNGFPITTPHSYGNQVNLVTLDFGNDVVEPKDFGNLVTWEPSPAHFGNIISPGILPVQPTPTFSPVAGAYGSVSVTITSVGATAIYYTLDGSTPTTGSTLYTGPITLLTSETIKAIATQVGYQNSAVGSATYTINGMQATPTFSPVAGTYSGTQSVTITSAGADTIYYTTDGSTPTTSSSVYSGPLNVSTTETVKALAVKAGWSNSAVGSAVYGIYTTVYVSAISGIHQNSNLSTGGGTDDTSLIQTVLSASYPTGLNLIVDGVSLITGLNVSSNTTITVNANCGFYLKSSSNREAIANAHKVGGNLANIVDTNITLTGTGEINCNYSGQTGTSMATKEPMCGVAFKGVNGLTLGGGLFIYNSASYLVDICCCENVVVNSMTLTQAAGRTTDGMDCLDLRGPCNNVAISNITASSGDDVFGFNSIDYDNGTPGSANFGPYDDLGGNINNITVSNIIFVPYSSVSLFGNGISCYSNNQFASYEVSNLSISNLSGALQDYVVSLQRNPGGGPLGSTGAGLYSNISVTNSSVEPYGIPLSAHVGSTAYLVDGTVDVLTLTNVGRGIIPATVGLWTSYASVTSLLSNGTQLGPVSGTGTGSTPSFTTLKITPAPPTPSFHAVQSNVYTAGVSLTTMPVTYTNNNTLGSLLICYALWYYSSGTPTASTVLGGVGNTWVKLAENLAVDAHHAVIVWACYNNQVSGSKVTVSATLGAGAVVGGNIMEIMEYVGQAASPFDSISAIQFKSGTSISCPSLITSQNNEIVIGFGTINGSTYPTDTSGSSVVQVNQPTYNEWAQDIYVPIAGTVVTPTWVDTSALGDFVCTVAFKSA